MKNKAISLLIASLLISLIGCNSTANSGDKEEYGKQSIPVNDIVKTGSLEDKKEQKENTVQSKEEQTITKSHTNNPDSQLEKDEPSKQETVVKHETMVKKEIQVENTVKSSAQPKYPLNKLENYFIEYKGKRYKLPFDTSVLEGWVCEALNTKVEPKVTLFGAYYTKNGYNDVEIEFFNNTTSVKKASECKIALISTRLAWGATDKGKTIEISLPGGIKVGSTYQEVIDAFGKPITTIDSKNDNKLLVYGIEGGVAGATIIIGPNKKLIEFSIKKTGN